MKETTWESIERDFRNDEAMQLADAESVSDYLLLDEICRLKVLDCLRNGTGSIYYSDAVVLGCRYTRNYGDYKMRDADAAVHSLVSSGQVRLKDQMIELTIKGFLHRSTGRIMQHLIDKEC